MQYSCYSQVCWSHKSSKIIKKHKRLLSIGSSGFYSVSGCTEVSQLSVWPIISNAGQFYAPDGSDGSVMGLSTDLENSLLVTGDTAGFIKVWDISQYALSAADTEVWK